MPSEAGTLVAGRYRLAELIGQDGLSRVWRGHDEVLDRVAALKEVLLPPGDQAASRAAVIRAAKAAARLDHPGVITVYDVLEHEDTPWIVMRHVPGPDLGAELARAGRLPWLRAARIGEQVADALAYAHAAGVPHGDLKPGNILLDGPSNGLVTVTGFGLARALAPEQLDDDPRTSPPADLRALGAILYTATEGTPPCPASTTLTATTLTASAATRSQRPAAPEPAAAPAAPSEHAGPLRALIESLLAEDPAARPDAKTATAALAALIAAPPPSPSPVQPPPVQPAPVPPLPAPPALARPPAPSAPPPSALPRSAPSASAPRPAYAPSAPPGSAPRPGSAPPASPAVPPRRRLSLLTGLAIAAVMIAALILVTTIFAPKSGHRAGPAGAVLSATQTTVLRDPGGFTVKDVAFSADGKTVAASFASRDAKTGRVDLWTSAGGAPSRSLAAPGDGPVSALAASPTSAGSLAGGTQAGVEVWQASSRAPTIYGQRGQAPPVALGYAPDGRAIAVLGADGRVHLLDLATGQWSARQFTSPASSSPGTVSQVAVSPAGQLLAVAYGGKVAAWKWSGGAPLVTVTALNGSGSGRAVVGATAQPVAFSPDGKTLAVAGSHEVRLWQVATKSFAAPLTAAGASPEAVAYSPNGATLAVGDGAGLIYLWDLADGHVTSVPAPVADWGGLAFSPDGETLAAFATGGQAVYLYRVQYAGS